MEYKPLTKHDKNLKHSVLFIFRHQLDRFIYCESGVFTCQCIPFIIRLIELIVAGQKSKIGPCTKLTFCKKKNAISFEFLYSGFVLCNIQALYTQLYIFPFIGLCAFARYEK